MALSRDELLRQLFLACRNSKHPSRSLSDAISQHLVVADWSDDDPRWKHFAWPNWLASEDSADNLVRHHIGVTDFGISGMPADGGRTHLAYASGGRRRACAGYYRNAAIIGAAIKWLREIERREAA